VEQHAYLMRLCPRHQDDELKGKYCLPYNIAAAIIDGKINYGAFTEKRAAQDGLQAFMTRVHRIFNNTVTLRRPHIADGNPEARLRAKMRDGRVHDLVRRLAN